MADNSNSLPYNITLIEQGYEVGAGGKLTQVKTIHYKTFTGDTGSISVPLDQFNSDYVASLITAEIAEIAKLRGM